MLKPGRIWLVCASVRSPKQMAAPCSLSRIRMTCFILSPATVDWAKAKFCKAFDCPGHTWLSHLQSLTPWSLGSVQRWLWGDGLGNSVTSSTGQPHLPCLLRESGASPLYWQRVLALPKTCGVWKQLAYSFLDITPSPPPHRASACLTIFTYKDAVWPYSSASLSS